MLLTDRESHHVPGKSQRGVNFVEAFDFETGNVGQDHITEGVLSQHHRGNGDTQIVGNESDTLDGNLSD